MLFGQLAVSHWCGLSTVVRRSALHALHHHETVVGSKYRLPLKAVHPNLNHSLLEYCLFCIAIIHIGSSASWRPAWCLACACRLYLPRDTTPHYHRVLLYLYCFLASFVSWAGRLRYRLGEGMKAVIHDKSLLCMPLARKYAGHS